MLLKLVYEPYFELVTVEKHLNSVLNVIKDHSK